MQYTCITERLESEVQPQKWIRLLWEVSAISDVLHEAIAYLYISYFHLIVYMQCPAFGGFAESQCQDKVYCSFHKKLSNALVRSLFIFDISS